VSKQCAVLEISQEISQEISGGSVYYEPVAVSAGDLALMRRLDELHENVESSAWPQGIFVSATRHHHQSGKPGLGIGHHLHSDGARLRLSRRRHGLVRAPVLAWRLSITLWVWIFAWRRSMRLCGPEIFNTDQGIQFTSDAFTELLVENDIAISMDGKGSWRDNVFIERFGAR
jgi:hypothetical protein